MCIFPETGLPDFVCITDHVSLSTVVDLAPVPPRGTGPQNVVVPPPPVRGNLPVLRSLTLCSLAFQKPVAKTRNIV